MIARPGFEKLTYEEYEDLCNGMGPDGIIGYLVPETAWGYKLSDCADRHDFGYYKADNLIDKLVEDVVLLWNCWEEVKKGSKYLLWLRQNRVLKIFRAVLYLGRFFLDKKFDKPAFYSESVSKVHEYALSILDKPYTYEIISNDIYRIWFDCKFNYKEDK
jgi:hypothetical protein